MTPLAVLYEKQPGKKSRTYHGLLVLIGLDAADEEGLAHTESPHQQLQRALELAAERRRALPRLCSLQNRSAERSGNERITLPFPSRTSCNSRGWSREWGQRWLKVVAGEGKGRACELAMARLRQPAPYGSTQAGKVPGFNCSCLNLPV